MKKKTQSPSWQREESRILYRDLFFMLVALLLSIVIAEQFLIPAASTPVDRLYAYVIVFIPLTIINLIAHYVYRNRKIRQTGNLRTSLRYRISLVFMLVSVIPSIPIFLISSNMVEDLVKGMFRVDVAAALQSAERVMASYRREEDLLFLEKLQRELPGLAKNRLPGEARVNKLFKSGVLTREKNYAALFGPSGKVFEVNHLLPSHQLDELKLTEPGWSGRELILNGMHFSFFRYTSTDGKHFFLIANRYYVGQESEVDRFKQVHSKFNEQSIWKEQISGRLRLILVLIYASMIGFALITAWFISRRISLPIVTLAQATRDISDGKLDTKLNINAEGEMGTLIESFNQMTAELSSLRGRLLQSQRMAAWQEVAQRLAHEIKNPLTPIQLSAERMQRRIKNPGKVDLLAVVENGANTIIKQVNTLKLLVKEFAEFARMPRARLRPDNINPIISETVYLFRESTSIEIKLNLAEDLPQIEIDKNLILGMLNNLVKNGIEAIESADNTRPDSEKIIEITTDTIREGARRYVRLKIEDSGPGVEMKLREKIFEPYYSTKGEQGGGLGLALVERAILEHDARIRVDRSRLGGAEFVILFRLK